MSEQDNCNIPFISPMPDMKNNVGHFNVFKHIPFQKQDTRPLPYQRRDYFKILLAYGQFNVQYADKVVAARERVLMFSNPHVPYQIESFDHLEGTVYCIFSKHFFYNFGNLKDYPVFQPGNTNIFEITKEQAAYIMTIFDRMMDEMNSEYSHKYDLMRNYIFEILHYTQRNLTTIGLSPSQTNASQRITNMFAELLERQFPIDETHRVVDFRTPSEFAQQLNVHVNHLNRALKQTTGKTSTDIINERFIQEAKILLKQSSWTVSEICYALGFQDIAYFSNYFKKHTAQSPAEFRKY
jgi:AraC-like DNA-binding protein